MSERRQYIIVDPKDNVATAIVDLKAGDTFKARAGEVILQSDIPFGHKFALSDISRNAYVIKYGAQIGRATAPISKGEHVHVHNVADIVDEVRKG